MILLAIAHVNKQNTLCAEKVIFLLHIIRVLRDASVQDVPNTHLLVATSPPSSVGAARPTVVVLTEAL